MQNNRNFSTIERKNTMTEKDEMHLLHLEDKYDVSFEALPEDIRVRGNALASGDDELDREAEDEIISRLESGDIFAWFTAKVTVRDDKGNEATDYLGCCNYRDEDDFRMGGYYLDMVEECVRQLNLAE
jgi:hypothetical protein